MPSSFPLIRGLGLIVPFLGSKRKLLDVILPIIPPHRTYVEAFAGGASVFFSKPEAERNILNEKDVGLYRFYRNFSCRKLDRCKRIRNVCAFVPGAVRRVIDKASGDVCDQIAARRFSILSEVGAGIKKKQCKVEPIVTRRLEKKCPEYERRLRNAKITNLDYQDVIKRYDSPDTFIFADPPYPGTTPPTRRLGPGQVPPESVCNLARLVKGKMLITYNDHPQVRRACAGLWHLKVPSMHASKMLERRNPYTHELLIANYRFPGATKLQP